MFAIEFGVFAPEALFALKGIIFSAAVGGLPLGVFFAHSHGVSFVGWFQGKYGLPGGFVNLENPWIPAMSLKGRGVNPPELAHGQGE